MNLPSKKFCAKILIVFTAFMFVLGLVFAGYLVTGSMQTAKANTTNDEIYVASVTTTDGAVKQYPTFADAVTAANAATTDCEIKLLENCTGTGKFEINNTGTKTITLNIEDKILTLSEPANWQSTTDQYVFFEITTPFDLKGNKGQIFHNAGSKGECSCYRTTADTATFRMYDGVNINCSNGGYHTRVINICNGASAYLYGGEINVNDNETLSTLVNQNSSVYVYGGIYHWNVTGDKGYWAGVTDSFVATTFQIFGGYFDGPLWWGDSAAESAKYIFYGGKYTTNLIKINDSKAAGTENWTNYIGTGRYEKSISETIGSVTYTYEITYNPVHTVTFNPGDGATVEPTSKKVVQDGSSTYGDLPTPVKTGAKFSGWFTGEGGTGTQILSTTVVEITSDQILYAKWQEKSDPPIRGYTFTSPTNLIYDGKQKVANITSTTTGLGAITVEYSSDGGKTWSSTAPKDVGTYEVRANVAESDTYKSGIITDEAWTFKVTPLQLTISGTKVNNKVYDGTTDATATAGKLDNAVEGDDVEVTIISATFADANAGSGKAVTIKYSISGESAGNYLAPKDETITGTIKKAPQDPPSGLTKGNETNEGYKDGKIIGVTDKMQYSADKGETWTTIAKGKTEITDLSKGDYLVRYAEDNNYYASEGASVTLTVIQSSIKKQEDSDKTGVKEIDEETLEEVTEEAKTDYQDSESIQLEIKIDKQAATDNDEVQIEAQNSNRVVEYKDIQLLLHLTKNGSTSTVNYGNQNKDLIEIEHIFDYNTKPDPQVWRVHDGQVAQLTEEPNQFDEYIEYDKEDGTINVNAMKYSTYAISYAKESSDDNGGGEVAFGEAGSASTGDYDMLILHAAAAFVFVSAACLAFRRKQNCQ